jgi:uncharacterized membrane protein YhaH (DUF805 family)
LKGNVVGFDPDTNTGAISGDDGRRYDFATSDWRSRARPKHGDLVDFAAGDQHAAQIYLIGPEYVAPSFAQFYFSPSGRISRSQYWLRLVLPMFIIAMILNLMELAGGKGILTGIFQLIALWPGFVVSVKRIHDRNKSGWLVWAFYGPFITAMTSTIVTVIVFTFDSSGAASLLGVISGVLWVVALVVGIWFFVEFGCMRGTVGANRYGPDPVPAP